MHNCHMMASKAALKLYHLIIIDHQNAQMPWGSWPYDAGCHGSNHYDVFSMPGACNRMISGWLFDLGFDTP